MKEIKSAMNKYDRTEPFSSTFIDVSPEDRKNLLKGSLVKVLDKGYVEFQDMMGDDGSIVSAARASYLSESKGAEKDKKLLFYMLRNGHTSPFEQVAFRFRIKAPLITFWQLVRHRTGKFNLQSGRYTEFEEDEFYIPEDWRKQSVDNKQSSYGTINEEESQFLTLEMRKMANLCYESYKRAISFGVAREQARLFLPGFSVYYTGVFQMDAHNLMHFLKLRMQQEAQYEIRVYADAIYNSFFKVLLPWTAEAFEEYILKKDKE